MHLGVFTNVGSTSPFAPGSPQATAIADLFLTTLVICAGIFLVVTGLVVYCIVKFRDPGGAAGGAKEPVQVHGNKRMEMAWTLGPVAILAWLLLLTVRAMNASDPPVDREPDLTIIGHQWWWEVKYPSGVITANEIHVPTGKPLVVRIESRDVVHDYWVPELGRKIDAMPGRPTAIWMQANQPGTYLGTCAEYCGAQHAWMRILVVAETPEKFAEWEKHQLAPPPHPTTEPALRGAKIFNEMTCVKCHSIGTHTSLATTHGRGVLTTHAEKPSVGPDLTHIAQRRTLGAGVLDNTPADMARWLKDPQGVKAGCHMPDAQLTDPQVADLVAYFGTLQ